MRRPLTPVSITLGVLSAAVLVAGAFFEKAWLVLALLVATAAVLEWLPTRGEAVKAWLSHGGFVVAMWLVSQGSTDSALSAPSFAIAVLAGMSLVIGGEAMGRQVYWLASLAVFGGLIAFFSSPSGGSGGMLDWAARFGLDPATADLIVKAIRKTIHFAFYGCFAFAAFRAFGSRGWQSAAIAFAFVAAHAMFDEARQRLSPMRTGSAWDVLLDLAGAAAFIAYAIRRERPARVSE